MFIISCIYKIRNSFCKLKKLKLNFNRIVGKRCVNIMENRIIIKIIEKTKRVWVRKREDKRKEKSGSRGNERRIGERRDDKMRKFRMILESFLK